MVGKRGRAIRGCVRIIAVAVLIGSGLVGAPVRAQQAVSFAGPSAQGGPAIFSQAVAVSDVFLGRNVVGPYLLTWKDVEPGTEIVSRGARRLARDVDYRVDVKAGTLTFTAPLRAREIARIDYHYDPKTAVANNGGILPPLQLSLFDFAHGALTFNALVKPGQEVAGQAGGKGMMLLAMGGSAKLSSASNLSSKLFVDLMGGNVLSRSGMQLKEDTTARYGKLSASFTRAGADFKGPEDAGVAAGKQIFDLNAALNPIRGITASASFQQTTELPDKGKGTTTAVLGQRLGGTLGARTRFTASRTETTIASADSPDVVRTANRLQVDHKLDNRTQATAVFEQNATQSGDSHSLIQGTTLQVRSQPTEKVTLFGTFGNRLTASGGEDTDSLKVSAEATKQLKLSATLGDKYTEKSATHTREASVDYAPLPQLTLTGLLQMRAEAQDSAVAHGIAATVKPNKFLEFSGGAKLREAVTQGNPDPTAPDTFDLRVALSLPNKVIRLSGGYSYNPEDERGAVTRAKNRNINLQSTLGAFDLGGGYTIQEELLTTKVNSALDLQFGWRFASTTQIATTFRQTQAFEQNLLSTDTYGIRLTHRVGSMLDLMLGGTMTTYLRDGAELQKPDYRAEAKVGIRF